MDKSVIISIKGTQTYEDAEPETIELVTEGRLMDCGDEGYTFSYQESELTGLEGTLTTFQVEPDRITLMRMGKMCIRDRNRRKTKSFRKLQVQVKHLHLQFLIKLIEKKIG